MLLLLLACTSPGATGPKQVAPFDMPLRKDGVLYAGVSTVELGPEVPETFSDLNGDGLFDGCVNEPLGLGSGRADCAEPFLDANGNGYFDAIWLGGFETRRAAMAVHDPMTVRVLVLALNGTYVALVAVDSVGLLESRVRQAREMLAEDGFDRNHIVVSSTHSHAAPDTVGMWGDQDQLVSGINPTYADTIVPGIYDAVSLAAGDMQPVNPTVGMVQLADLDPTFTGVAFGGTNPDDWMYGTIMDLRDPIIADDHLLAIALDGPEGRLATLLNYSSHPEAIGERNNEVSADYVYYFRDYVERTYGGTAVFLPGALGGQQVPYGATLPVVRPDGTRVLDENGQQTYTGEMGYEFAEMLGILLGQSVDEALTDTQTWDQISVRYAELPVPVTNQFYQLAFRLGLLDSTAADLLTGADCPNFGVGDNIAGCVPLGIWELRLGPVTLATFPGELVPELFWGVPDEPAMADASLRHGDPRWHEQDPDCDDIPFEQCRDTNEVGDCDCLSIHALPYRISDDPDLLPIRDLLPGQYVAPVGIVNGYCGYIVPGPDFNRWVSPLTDLGDHYEESNSCTSDFAPLVQEAWRKLAGK